MLEAAQPYINPLVLIALITGAGLIGLLLASHRMQAFARDTVAAVYRVGLHTAAELGAGGIAWLRSPAGVDFRRALASRAYDAIPARVGVIPVGLVKLVVSRERFSKLVDAAFHEMAALASTLEDTLSEADKSAAPRVVE